MKPDLTRPVDFTTYNGTDKVCTRRGVEWHKFTETVPGNQPIAGYFNEHKHGLYITTATWGLNERYYLDKKDYSDLDLFYALPEKVEKTFWIVVTSWELKRKKISEDSKLHKSEEDARLAGYPDNSQIVPITLLVEE